jgi:SAM-dependent methyltransferase
MVSSVASSVAMPEEQRHDSLRRSYDAVAEEYAARLNDELDYKPFDRGLLAALIEQSEPETTTADVGCGPAHVAAWLRAHGADSVGIDLSPAMIEVARRLHPEVPAWVGDLLALPADDAEFGAAVALYSIIHLEPHERPLAFSELHRVLRPNGLLLVSFHVGTDVQHRDEWLGHEVDIDFRLLEPATIVAEIEAAGFSLEMAAERVAYPEEADTRRAYLLARRPA